MDIYIYIGFDALPSPAYLVLLYDTCSTSSITILQFLCQHEDMVQAKDDLRSQSIMIIHLSPENNSDDLRKVSIT